MSDEAKTFTAKRFIEHEMVKDRSDERDRRLRASFIWFPAMVVLTGC